MRRKTGNRTSAAGKTKNGLPWRRCISCEAFGEAGCRHADPLQDAAGPCFVVCCLEGRASARPAVVVIFFCPMK
jgi:hypothetical protein